MKIFFILSSMCVLAALFSKDKILWYLIAIVGYILYFNGGLKAATQYTWTMGSYQWLLFFGYMFGLIILIAEIYIPSFGILSVIGTGLTLWSLYQFEGSVMSLVLLIISTAVALGLLTYILYKRGDSLQLSKDLVLESQTIHHQALQTSPQESQEIGQVISDLRPVGKGKIQGEIVEMVALSDYIEAGQTVQVKYTRQGRAYVELLSHGEEL